MINTNTYARKALSVTFSMLLVMTLLLGAISTPAQAQTAEPGECTAIDDFIMFLTIGAVNAESCSRQAYVDAAISDMQESDANQTKTDLYSAATSQKAGEETFNKPFQNNLQDTESVAWSKAEVAIAESYQDGNSKASAKIDAQEAIDDYYTVKQINLINQWNQTINSHQTLHEKATSETDISSSYVGIDKSTSGGTASIDSLTFGTTTVTLANGTEWTAKTITADVSTGRWGFTETATVNSGTQSTTKENDDGFEADTFNFRGLGVKPPNENYDKLTYGNFNTYQSMWNSIDTKSQNLQSESGTFVDSTYSDYESGDINASDVISRNTAMFQYGVEGTNSDDLNRVTASLALGGFDLANVDNAGTMEIAYNSNTYDGLLLTSSAPNGSWQTNTVYNTSNFDDPVFIATTDGKKIDLPNTKAEFQIVSMTNKEGESIETINTTKYNYQTSNTTDLNNKIDRLVELRDSIEEMEQEIGGGGGVTDGGSGLLSGLLNSLPSWLTNSYMGIPLYVIVGVGGIVLIGLGRRE